MLTAGKYISQYRRECHIVKNDKSQSIQFRRERTLKRKVVNDRVHHSCRLVLGSDAAEKSRGEDGSLLGILQESKVQDS